MLVHPLGRRLHVRLPDPGLGPPEVAIGEAPVAARGQDGPDDHGVRHEVGPDACATALQVPSVLVEGEGDSLEIPLESGFEARVALEPQPIVAAHLAQVAEPRVAAPSVHHDR